MLAKRAHPAATGDPHCRGQRRAMTTITMRHTKGAFVVTGNDIEARTFGSRREAKDWCADHYPFSNKGDRAGRRQEPTQKPGHRAMVRLEQRGAVAFTFIGIAVALILLITVWEYLF
jgi:hypothetical protein